MYHIAKNQSNLVGATLDLVGAKFKIFLDQHYIFILTKLYCWQPIVSKTKMQINDEQKIHTNRLISVDPEDDW